MINLSFSNQVFWEGHKNLTGIIQLVWCLLIENVKATWTFCPIIMATINPNLKFLHWNPYRPQDQWVAKHLFSIINHRCRSYRRSWGNQATPHTLAMSWYSYEDFDQQPTVVSCPPLFFCFLIGLDQLFSCFCCCSKKSLQHLLHDSCSHFAVSYD